MMVIHIMILLHFLLFAEVTNADRAPATTATFFELASEKNYVDKTGLLIDFISSGTCAVYLLAPRQFGKTINNQMINDFFNVKFEEDCYTLIENRTAHPLYNHFKNKMAHLQVVQNEEFFNEHFGNYIVISIALGQQHARSAEELKGQLNNAIYRYAFADFLDWWLYFGSKDKICTEDLVCYQMLTKIFEQFNLSHNEEIDWYIGLSCLFDTLRLKYKKKVILLVDDFDYSVLYSLRKFSYTSAKDILEYLRYIFGCLTKAPSPRRGWSQYPVFRSMFTGITQLPIELRSQLNNVKVYTYFQKNPLSEYYGFRQSEVDKLLQDYKHLDKSEEVKDYYDGYKVIGLDWQNYNPLSIAKFLKSDGKIISYWRQTTTDLFLFRFCTDPKVLDKIKLLALGEKVYIQMLINDRMDDLQTMKQVLDICESEKALLIEINEYHRIYFFKYLLQEGYLCPADSSRETCYYIAPNEEIRQEFCDMYTKFVDEVINLDTFGITNVFWTMAETGSINEKHVNKLSENFHRFVQNRIQSVDGYHYNEQALQNLVYFSCKQRTIVPNKTEFVLTKVKVRHENFINLMTSNGGTTKILFESKSYGKADIYFKLNDGKTIMILKFKSDTNIDAMKAQVWGYRPRVEDEANCEKLVLVWVAVPPCPPRNDPAMLQKMLQQKLKVSLGCYIINNYNSGNMLVAQKCVNPGEIIEPRNTEVVKPIRH